MGWSYDVIHWGAAYDAGADAEPRISISMEFARECESSERLMPSLGASSPLPTFAERLYVIGRAIIDYQRFERLMIRYEEFARRMTEHVKQM